MEINIKILDEFKIVGYGVKTNLENNEKDISNLFNDFFKNKKENNLKNIFNCKGGLYTLLYYTNNKKEYYYILGKKLEKIPQSSLFKDIIIKNIPKTKYAVTKINQELDIIKGLTEDFYNEIPKLGYIPNDELGFYFEYYAKGINGDCELYVPIIKK